MSGTRPTGAIVGVGELTPTRTTSGKTTLGMLAEASRLALEDSGLDRDRIDGLLVGPQVGETPQHVPATVAEYLGITPRMSNVVDLGGASGPGMIWRAAAAINAGMATAVLCVLGNHREPVPSRSPNRNPIREFDVPFGASGANTAYALLKTRHMHDFGTTDEQFASLAAVSRANAQSNPDAIFYGKPIDTAGILASPMIAEPLHLLEIVMPVAGGDAVIVMGAEAAEAATLRHAPVYLRGAGEMVTHRAMSQAPSYTTGPLKPSMAQALAQAGIGIDRIDLLSLYDCYTVMLAITIEDAGLCAPGQFGAWAAGRDLSHTGDVALNTHGGQLGFGQADLAGGMSHVVEAVRQLRGTADGRQMADAALALVTGNGATMSEAVALVLGRDR
ncbi:acetyl-CoA acetyltransferase [Conyzicola lurida]|uniref:Acetyl-CoA acetyltransferase n=1 Tax=Conyzicola lurida TaxID=1172621 RepID=A0A841AJ11_9MICO|nr:thiolase family protein [Conyzicola lurida]MBB5842424.1 acetyl-CoA acetyltransferase [Conyzicola lurida]